jgi:hypothetical protein
MYGRFHTFARKIDGRGRIVADYDTDDGGGITPETFAAGAIVDDTAAP